MIDEAEYSGRLSVEIIRANLRDENDQQYVRRHGSMCNRSLVYYSRLQDDIADRLLIVSLIKSRSITERGVSTDQQNTRKFVHHGTTVDQALVDLLESFLDSGQFPSSDLSTLPQQFSSGRTFFSHEVSTSTSAGNWMRNILCFDHGTLRYVTKSKVFRGPRGLNGNGHFQTFEFEDHESLSPDRRRHFLDPSQTFVERLSLTLEEFTGSKEHYQHVVRYAHVLTRWLNIVIDNYNGLMIVKSASTPEENVFEATKEEYRYDPNTEVFLVGGRIPRKSLDKCKDLVVEFVREHRRLCRVARLVSSYGYPTLSTADEDAVRIPDRYSCVRDPSAEETSDEATRAERTTETNVVEPDGGGNSSEADSLSAAFSPS